MVATTVCITGAISTVATIAAEARGVNRPAVDKNRGRATIGVCRVAFGVDPSLRMFSDFT
ncbi:hypothetical protein PSEUDO9AG_50381 [Pseudomonas sp. 9Ag]|nr:hypothetical protein PSEUDO9AG_50381 [Pseudomonas sp. 9Ag]